MEEKIRKAMLNLAKNGGRSRMKATRSFRQKVYDFVNN
jgi:hypothetical protein